MPIDVERRDHVAIVTLNRPEVLNAFNTEHLALLRERIEDLSNDRDIRVIVLTGAGNRAFAAGADISEMRDKTPQQALEFARLGQAVAAALESAPQPVIAAVNGFALGGGCELALACDIRLASENAMLGQPEVTLGVPPGWGGSQRLTRLVGPGLTKELIYSGRRVTAEEAARVGLVNAVYPLEQLLDKTMELAGQIAANAPLAVQASKDAINRTFDVDLDSGLAYEARVFALCFGTADQQEGMGAFLERRKPVFQGQ
jgi:enoyl-CoA hydratase